MKKHAMWIHGHSLALEQPAMPWKVSRQGNGIHLKATGAMVTWVHFAIPSPVLEAGKRLRIGPVILRFKTGAGGLVTNVHLWDGEKKFAWWNNLKLKGSHLAEVFDPSGHPAAKWGLGVSIRVGFLPDTTPRTVHFIGAGCDFLEP